jgi:hypothetical protein
MTAGIRLSADEHMEWKKFTQEAFGGGDADDGTSYV